MTRTDSAARIDQPAWPYRLTLAGILLAAFGPALAYTDAWDGGHSVFKLLALCVGAGTALIGVTRLAATATPDRMPQLVAADKAVLAYVAWTAVATVFSPEPLLSMSGWRIYWDGLAAALAAGACYAATRWLGATAPRDTRRRLVGAACVTFLVLLGALVLALTGASGTASLLRAGRWGSLMGQPTFLAGLSVSWLPALAALCIPALRPLIGSSRPPKDVGTDVEATSTPRALLTPLVLPAFLAAALMLVGTRSRSGLLAAAIGLALLAVLGTRDRMAVVRRSVAAVLLIAVAVGALAVIRPEAGSSLPQRLAALPRSLGEGSGVTRTAAWHAAVETLAERPLLGTGPGTFGYTYAAAVTPPVYLAEPDTLMIDAHDWYLNAASTAGIPAGLAALAIVAAAFARAIALRGHPGLELGAATGVVAYGAHCVFTPNSIATFPPALVLLALAAMPPPARVATRTKTALEPASSAETPSVAAPAHRSLRFAALALIGAVLVVWGARTTAAEIAYASGVESRSIDRLRLAERLAPEAYAYPLRLGWALLAVDDTPDAAMTVLRSAIARSPRNGQLVVEAGRLVARAAAQGVATTRFEARVESAWARALDESVGWLAKGVELRPADPSARSAYAWGLALAGRTEDARRELRVLEAQVGADHPLAASVAARLE